MMVVMGRRALALIAMLGAGCGSEPPDIVGLTDQVAVVGQELVVELVGTDPEGGSLTYGVHADVSLEGRASISLTPTGNGVFRWTPLAEDVGVHAFDFTVSDDSNDTTVTISIDVRSTAGGIPIFRQPLGAGRVVNFGQTPCVKLDILVEDQDSAQVTIGEEEPRIEGATLVQIDGATASWEWCPTPPQLAAADRFTLGLSADDGDHPRTMKEYVIVRGGSGGPGLVINEVDYDIVGTDSTEYLELVNPSGGVTSLAGVEVVLVNGATNTEYSSIKLSSLGSLAAGKYIVIAGPGVSVPASAIKIDPLWTTDQIQNGAPDGIAIVDTVTQTVIDAVSYEGSITAATITGFPASITFVEGTALDPGVADSNTVTKTLCRSPNARDTNDAAADWALCSARTVGTANQP